MSTETAPTRDFYAELMRGGHGPFHLCAHSLVPTLQAAKPQDGGRPEGHEHPPPALTGDRKMALASEPEFKHAPIVEDGSQPRVVLLGTGGGPPAVAHRANTATAVVIGDAVYVVDCGRGAVSAYVNAGLSLGDLRAVFVTHMHADHTGELINFFLYGLHPQGPAGGGLPARVRVFGPGRSDELLAMGTPVESPICPSAPMSGTADLVAHSIAAHAGHLNVAIAGGFPDLRETIAVTELTVANADNQASSLALDLGLDVVAADLGVFDAGANSEITPPMEPVVIMEDDRVRVSTILVPHGGMFPALAYRFDTELGSVVVSGDTAKSENVVTLAAGSDLLIHEVMDSDAMVMSGLPEQFVHEILLRVHTDTGEVGEVGSKAGVGRLALHHFVPAQPGAVSDDRWRNQVSRRYDGEVIVGRDLLNIPFGNR